MIIGNVKNVLEALAGMKNVEYDKYLTFYAGFGTVLTRDGEWHNLTRAYGVERLLDSVLRVLGGVVERLLKLWAKASEDERAEFDRRRLV